MKNIILLMIFSKFVFGDFCPEPTFEDEFDGDELSKIWSYEQGYSFEGSASIFSKTNATTETGFLNLTVNSIGTTDAKGDFYRSTSGGVTTNIEFGYGKYEFRLSTAGSKAISETIHLIWVDDGDYAKGHQFIGLDFQEKGYMTLLAVNSTDKELNAFHGTETDPKTKAFVKLNSKPRFFTIDYTEDMINWYYDNQLIRQETTAVKTLPTKKFTISIRNWLSEKNQYNIEADEFPIQTKIDYFRFTAEDIGGDSCQKIEIEDPEEIQIDEVNSSNSSVTSSSKPKSGGTILELSNIIKNLSEDENHLLGFSGTITEMSVFKDAKVVWIYSDGEWKGYSPYQKIRDTLDKNGINTIWEIPPYTGFWIQK